MKLKKIASLMLAGIMAVSMLAGCDGKGGSGEEENPVVPAETGVVAYANDALTADQKEVFTYAASADLDAILKDLASSTSNFDADKIEKIYTEQFSSKYSDLSGKLRGKLDGIIREDGKFNNPPADGKSQKNGYVYTISGRLDAEEAIGKVAGAVGYYVESDNDTNGITCPDVVTYNSTNYDCAYSAEISAVKVSSSSAPNESAWVVAIVLTQNLTKVSNTVA